MNGEQTLAHFLRKIKIAVAIKILGRLNIFQWFGISLQTAFYIYEQAVCKGTLYQF